MKVELVTFYERIPNCWEVYKHYYPGNNEEVGSFKTEYEAMRAAFAFDVPVLRGSNADTQGFYLDAIETAKEHWPHGK